MIHFGNVTVVGTNNPNYYGDTALPLLTIGRAVAQTRAKMPPEGQDIRVMVPHEVDNKTPGVFPVRIEVGEPYKSDFIKRLGTNDPPRIMRRYLVGSTDTLLNVTV